MDYSIEKIVAAKGLFLLLGVFLVMLLAVALMAGAVAQVFPADSRGALLLTSVLQGAVAFFLPAWLSARMSYGAAPFFRRTASTLSLDKAPTWRGVAGVLIVFMIGLPALNQLISWNQSLHFPESMSAVENTLRQWEVANGGAAGILLSTDSWWGLISGVTVVGLVTGFCEEIFFRGALQRYIGAAGFGSVVAVVVAAFIFSAVHFQFFGFLPRFVLGAFFGYLLVRSGSLWLAAIAHALNNSMVVVTSWLGNNGIDIGSADAIGVSADGAFPWIPLASVIALCVFFYFFGNYFFSPSSHH